MTFSQIFNFVELKIFTELTFIGKTLVKSFHLWQLN